MQPRSCSRGSSAREGEAGSTSRGKFSPVAFWARYGFSARMRADYVSQRAILELEDYLKQTFTNDKPDGDSEADGEEEDEPPVLLSCVSCDRLVTKVRFRPHLTSTNYRGFLVLTRSFLTSWYVLSRVSSAPLALSTLPPPPPFINTALRDSSAVRPLPVPNARKGGVTIRTSGWSERERQGMGRMS
jgi:hypothetical protein